MARGKSTDYTDYADSVSWFQGFIQIGIAIGIDCLTTEHRTNGKARLCFRLFSAVRGALVALPWRHITPHRENASRPLNV